MPSNFETTQLKKSNQSTPYFNAKQGEKHVRGVPGTFICACRLVGRRGQTPFAAQPSSGMNQPLSPSHAAGRGFAASTCKPPAQEAASLLAQLFVFFAPATTQEKPAAAHHHPALLLSQEGAPGRRGAQRCWARLCNSEQRFTPILLQQETQKKPPILFTAEAGRIIIIIG